MNVIRMKVFSVMLLAAVILTGTVTAQAQYLELKANVPFGFRLGDNYLPAGEYAVQPMQNGVILLVNRQTNQSAMAHTFGIRNSAEPITAKLVFSRYGQDTFLSEIWADGKLEGRTPVPSKMEKELARIHTPVRINAIAGR